MPFVFTSPGKPSLPGNTSAPMCVQQAHFNLDIILSTADGVQVGRKLEVTTAHMLVKPSKHKTFVSHLYNVGPTSSTLVHHCTDVIKMFCVCCEEI